MSDPNSLDNYPGFNELAFAYDPTENPAATFKAFVEDFQVEEDLGFSLSGEGEHLWLFLEARDMNTDYLLRQLASAFSIPRKNISYSGKKDRRAITRQWFSLHLPGVNSDIPAEIHPNVTLLQAQRHQKKLRRGSHACNRFVIRLRDVDWGDTQRARLQQIREQGFPNYFGSQRFGHNGANIAFAKQAVISAKRLKRLERDRVFSTLRAWDFNRLLSLRVASHHWRGYLPGDAVQLSGSQSIFTPESWNEELQQRLDQGDIQISGMLPGKGQRQVPLADAVYESAPDLVAYLVKNGVEQGTRPLCIIPGELTFSETEGAVELRFSLPKGAYATSLLRELVVVNPVEQ